MTGEPDRTSATADPPVAVVTGANRGLGLEVCRQLAAEGFTVLLGSRDGARGATAAHGIEPGAGRVLPVELDVADAASVTRLADGLRMADGLRLADGRFASGGRGRGPGGDTPHGLGRADVLVNNAAILYDTWASGVDADLDQVREALETNLLGAWRMCEALIPLLRRSPHARIVNVSSGSGSLAEMGAGTPAYSVSKAALNAMTRILAAELRADGVLVNAVCPGWTETDMGGPGGRPVAEGAASIVWGALLDDDGPTGGSFRDGRPVAW
ncbi:MAG: SDR family NAD(P)-dependent oxidoreductase [Solirubrobacterales bacterium]|nr:SDR family NAD(P)-dependent oxidoreductase [Solirubrobacterales bacterium]